MYLITLFFAVKSLSLVLSTQGLRILFHNQGESILTRSISCYVCGGFVTWAFINVLFM